MNIKNYKLNSKTCPFNTLRTKNKAAGKSQTLWNHAPWHLAVGPELPYSKLRKCISALRHGCENMEMDFQTVTGEAYTVSVSAPHYGNAFPAQIL